MRITSVKELDELKKTGRESLHPGKIRISVGSSTCGIANGALDVAERLIEGAEREGMDVVVEDSGCFGLCQMEPLVDVWVPGRPRVVYGNITEDRVDELLAAVKEGRVIEDWALFRMDGEHHILTDERVAYDVSQGNGEYKDVPPMEDVGFFKGQLRIATRNCGYIKPVSLQEYVARGGLYTLHKVLTTMKPEQVIETVLASGLRGRGGGGFPTGRKWKIAHEAPGTVKHIVCNASEGDPGAYMDRSVLEGDPYSVLEGMIIGAYAIGNVADAYIYVGSDYPRVRRFLLESVATLRSYGVLGSDILGTGLGFDIHVVQGAGAFVCGEETALIFYIEGKRGTPRPRPPYPAVSGLWGKPTIINNVETWANVPAILSRGADWFSSIGSAGSKGTKVFSLVGNIKNTGLIEVPMGTPLWDLVFRMGGGITRWREFKGVQTGGPSGGCLPAKLLNIPVDFDRLSEAGSMMGSGSMIVMDEHTCMVDMAKYFLSFTKEESCGKCTPCREGLPHMLEILERISRGEGEEGDLELLEDLGTFVKENSLCGLGQTAPNPLLTTLHYYREDYESHIKYKKCPGSVCKRMVSAPCHHTCPVGMDAPTYIAHIALGKFDKALEVIYQATPFPGILSRICPHPCEFRCTTGNVADPISIRALKRFVLEKHGRDYSPPKGAGNLERVAVVGAGPAGLSCAWDLARLGYKVTVFEAADTAGGMLYSGIPAYRLPRELIAREVEQVRRMGVDIKTGVKIGKDVPFDDLRRDYKALFIATGAHVGIPLNLPGEDAEGVQDAIDFLREVNVDGRKTVGKRVGIIGGTNTALDAARTARRLGAERVTVFYNRTHFEIPADELEVQAGLDEGIDVVYLCAPAKIIAEKGHLKGLELRRVEMRGVDPTGWREPVVLEGTEFTVELDNLFTAVNQKPDLGFLPDGFNVTAKGALEADPGTMMTDTPGVFAGGDVVAGPYFATDAMGHGKLAAKYMDRYLRGGDMTPEYTLTKPTAHVEPYEMTAEEVETIVDRAETPLQPVAERIKNFESVELVLREGDAINEAKRCLRCDWRWEHEAEEEESR